MDLTGVAPGIRVLFTDPTGWTVGALTVTAAEGAGPTRLSVAAGPQVGVDRVWTLQAAGSLQGRLTLYYRNEIDPPPGVPDESWTRTDDALGDEMSLTVVQDGQALTSVANPWSNRASADVTVPAGTTSFVLRG